MRLGEIAQASNQNNYRLTDLCPIESLPEPIAQDVKDLLGSAKDRAHHTAGVFLWAAMTRKKPVLVLGSRDLDALILKASEHIPGGAYSVRSTRKDGMTIYGQFTGFMTKNGAMKILLPQNGKKPSVVEITYPPMVALLEVATDEIRDRVIKSVDNTTKPQHYDTTILQIYNTTTLQANPSSKHATTRDANETQDEQHKKPFFGKRKE